MDTREKDVTVFDIQRYSIHDGPGIRTVAFLKGCPLRCIWCCNPEGQSMSTEVLFFSERCIGCDSCVQACPIGCIEQGKTQNKLDRRKCISCLDCTKVCPTQALSACGIQYGVNELAVKLQADRLFFRRSQGGVTLSGGEPSLQAESVVALAKELRSLETDLVIETCGYAEWEKLGPLVDLCSMILFDIKHMDSNIHQEITGVTNELILKNAEILAKNGYNVVFRLPLIPNLTDTNDNIEQLCVFLRKLGYNGPLKMLPYHQFGNNKYRSLGRDYRLAGIGNQSQDQLDNCVKIAQRTGLAAEIGG